MRTNSIVAALAASVCVTALATPAQAQQRPFDIPAGSLKAALDAYGRQSGRPIVYRSEDVRGAKSNGYKGSATPEAALEAVLTGSGFRSQAGSGTSVAIVRQQASSLSPATASDEIVVTGSRIAGAKSSSLITVTAENMRDAGQRQIGDVIRSLPQNFNGGQNPGVLFGSSNEADLNVNSTAGVNLRGLGPDATLTLLNGKRLAYDAVVQSVDISAIPLAAVERIEILTDGASAIYGSDAVAGVVNVILNKDFDGLASSARLSGAWDGGNVERQVSLVGGKRWDRGGFMIAADYSHNSAITAKDRDITGEMNGSATLLPSQTHYGVLLTGHQAIAEGLTFDIDALYNRRTAFSAIAYARDTDYLTLGTGADTKVESWVISPQLSWRVSDDWSASVAATYGKDKTDLATSGYQAATLSYIGYSRYDNRIVTGEINVAGKLFSLPGGSAKIAFGGGYRRNDLDSRQWTVMQNTTTPGSAFDEYRSATYLYAETELPIVSPDNQIDGVHRLAMTGAVRYERYKDIGDIATPKLGIVYAPAPFVSLRASWGRSFKAPTLRQNLLTQRAYLELPSSYSATGPSSGATVLLLSGGNRDLQPERAETWSFGTILTPTGLPNLKVELNYFHTKYFDRVITPLQGRAGALTNPVYADLIIANPSAAQVNAALAVASLGLQNYTGLPFSAANIAFIVDNRDRNAARQTIKGFDLTADYKFETSVGSFGLTGNLTYIESVQQLLPGQNYVQLAGTVFRPPHWRGRGGLSWHGVDLMAAGFVNYVGGVQDRRTAISDYVHGMTTVDLNVRYEPVSGPFKGFALSASVTNLLNAMPDTMRSNAPYIPPYDSTNYSILGRYLGLTLEKRW